MGLLADKRATGNITAVAPSTVYELTKADLKPILEARPVIAQELSRAMAQRLEAGRGELCRKIGDGVNQAADLISATASIPSLNFIPLTTFGNWF